MSAKSATIKKKKGVFYSPRKATEVMCDWAIRTADDTILEPSFGGCDFLRSSWSKLKTLGCMDPNQRLYGCDVQRKAFDHLYQKIGIVDIPQRFLLSDFLNVKPTDFRISNFDVVIGNPPYVALDDMYMKQRRSAKRSMPARSPLLHGKISLWAYFVLHSLQFLKVSGRMAWLLPGSLVHSVYGKQLIKVLEQRFGRLLLVPIQQKLFTQDGVKETTVVLLAEGWEEGPATNGVEIFNDVRSLEHFEETLSLVRNSDLAGKVLNKSSNYSSLTEQGRSLYELISERPEVKELGDLLDIKIGIVTGNNKFFVINEEVSRDKKLLNGDLKLIFSKLEIAPGLRVTKGDLRRAKANNLRCLLINTSNLKQKSSLSRYVLSYKKKDRTKVLTFKKRTVWHQPDDGKDPDAFFSYMSDFMPRLIINVAKTTCTNSIHRVYFPKNTPSALKKLVGISLATTYSGLSAEIEGRCYGDGVLKHEPSEAKRIRVFLPKDTTTSSINEVFNEMDGLLREGRLESAQRTADGFIFRSLGSQRGRILAALREELKEMRERRRN